MSHKFKMTLKLVYGNFSLAYIFSSYTVESHLRTRCDMCRRAPITRTWYRCDQCGNKDVCALCKATHPAEHSFTEIHSAEQEEEDDKQEEKKEADRSEGCIMM